MHVSPTDFSHPPGIHQRKASCTSHLRQRRPTGPVPSKSKTKVTRNWPTEFPEQVVFSKEGWGNVLLGQRWGLRRGEHPGDGQEEQTHCECVHSAGVPGESGRNRDTGTIGTQEQNDFRSNLLRSFYILIAMVYFARKFKQQQPPIHPHYPSQTNGKELRRHHWVCQKSHFLPRAV